MKEIKISDFKTAKDLYTFFESNFSGCSYSFIEIASKKLFMERFNCIAELLRNNDLRITEYDYFYRYFDESSMNNSPLWNQLKDAFSNSGRYITPLRQNVINFIENSSNRHSFEDDDIRVVAHNSIFLPKSYVLIVLGAMNWERIIDLYEQYCESIACMFFFPYPCQSSGFFNIQKFFEIKFTLSGVKHYQDIVFHQLSDALKNCPPLL